MSYNKLYERLLDQTHRSEIEKEREVSERLQNSTVELQNLEFQKAELAKKLDAYERAFMAKKIEVRAAELQEEELRMEISSLKVLNQEMQQFKEPIKEKKEEKPEDEINDGEKIFDKMGRDLGASQNAITDLEHEQEKKKDVRV